MADTKVFGADTDRIGDYELKRVVGEGGMGRVYHAFDTDLGRDVALKVLLPELASDRDAAQRFLREARAAAKLQHPNVVRVFQVGEHKGTPYLVMEFVQGIDLRARLRKEGPLPVDDAIATAQDCAKALRAADAVGLVHRDVKPANLMQLPTGEVKLADFGLARQLDGATDITQTGLVVGTPSYVAPEISRGGKASRASDIFALGCTTFQLLADRLPFEGATVLEILTRQINDPPLDLRELRPEVPLRLWILLQRMLAKDPDGRPKDYDEIIEGLSQAKEPIDDRTVEARGPSAEATTKHDDPTRIFESKPRDMPTPITHLRNMTTRALGYFEFKKPTQWKHWWRWNKWAAGGIGALFLVGLLSLFTGGDTVMDPKEADQVLKELRDSKDPDDILMRGHAHWVLDRVDNAFRAYDKAARADTRDNQMLRNLIAALELEDVGAAVDLLIQWPNNDVVSPLRKELKSKHWNLRHNAANILEERGVKFDQESFAIIDLKNGKTCFQRRRGALRLRKYGKGDRALEAIEEARERFPANLCMLIDLDNAEDAVGERQN